MPRYIEKAEKITLPVIPTRGLVAFPSIPLNFEIERDISLAALDAAAQGKNYVFLICQRALDIDEPAPADLYEVGCVCKIKQTLKAPDGITRVLAEGLCRGTALSFTSIGKCMYADIMTKTVSLSAVNPI